MFRMKRGDTAPPLQIILTDNGIAIDLTPATAVKVIGSRAGAMVFNRTVTGTDQGVVQMDWEDGDTGVPGLLNIEIEVEWPGGAGIQSFPPSGYLSVIVERDLG